MKTAATALSDGTMRKLGLTCLFGTFVFLQFTVLGLANHAGEGYLTAEQRVLVYYALQVFVILGYLLYALYARLCAARRMRRAVAYGVFGVLLACVAAMFAVGSDSAGSVAASMVAVLCVGGIGGAAHLRMSMATTLGDSVARCMGLGSAAAVVVQFLFQIQWGATPLLPVFMLAAVALLLFALLRVVPGTGVVGGEGSEAPEPASPKRIAAVVLIAATFILFTCFYNEHIHHLMIQSDYASYTVYSWPRLMLVPGYLLFAAIGDRKGGRYVPLVSLCIMLVSLLNVVLVGDAGAYWLNMCLFYFAIAAFTSYYLLTFWHLAPGTGNPAFWAPFGRMLDSGMVLFTGAVGLSTLPAAAVLGADVAGVALVIVLMALSGDFDLREPLQAPEGVAQAWRESVLPPEERVSCLARECGLTERECEILAALVLTEKTNQQIADDLQISRRQLQTHISRVYEKAGAETRVGLAMRLGDYAQPTLHTT